jgi:hypothetical protein
MHPRGEGDSEVVVEVLGSSGEREKRDDLRTSTSVVNGEGGDDSYAAHFRGK